jgi:hypothetical protein
MKSEQISSRLILFCGGYLVRKPVCTTREVTEGVKVHLMTIPEPTTQFKSRRLLDGVDNDVSCR